MGAFSIWHLLVVLAIALIIFGTKKLRDVGGDLGGAIRNFKSSMKDQEEEGQKHEVQDLKKTVRVGKKESSRVIEGKVVGRQTQKKKKA